MYPDKKNGGEHGVALISILLVVVIATVLGVKMTAEQYFSITRASNYFNQGKIRQYALGGEELARQMLYKDFTEQPLKDLLTEEWASKELKFDFVINTDRFSNLSKSNLCPSMQNSDKYVLTRAFA